MSDQPSQESPRTACGCWCIAGTLLVILAIRTALESPFKEVIIVSPSGADTGRGHSLMAEVPMILTFAGIAFAIGIISYIVSTIQETRRDLPPRPGTGESGAPTGRGPLRTGRHRFNPLTAARDTVRSIVRRLSPPRQGPLRGGRRH